MANIDALPSALGATARPGLNEIPFRGGGFVVKSHKGVGVIGFILILALWEISVRAGWINPIFLPAASDVLAALWKLAASGELWLHLQASLMRFAIGWSLGRSGFSTNAVLGWDQESGYVVRAEGYIDAGDQPRTKAAFDALEGARLEIESDFGAALTWTRRDDIRASRIYIAMQGGIDDSEDDLARYRSWLIDQLFAIRAAFTQRVRALEF